MLATMLGETSGALIHGNVKWYRALKDSLAVSYKTKFGIYPELNTYVTQKPAYK